MRFQSDDFQTDQLAHAADLTLASRRMKRSWSRLPPDLRWFERRPERETVIQATQLGVRQLTAPRRLHANGGIPFDTGVLADAATRPSRVNTQQPGGINVEPAGGHQALQLFALKRSGARSSRQRFSGEPGPRVRNRLPPDRRHNRDRFVDQHGHAARLLQRQRRANNG